MEFLNVLELNICFWI